MYIWCIVSQICVSQCVCQCSALHQVVLLQVELQDGVFDGGEDEADVLCVGGAGEVGVDDLVTVWVQVHEHLEDKLSPCLGISLRPWRGEDSASWIDLSRGNNELILLLLETLTLLQIFCYIFSWDNTEEMTLWYDVKSWAYSSCNSVNLQSPQNNSTHNHSCLNHWWKCPNWAQLAIFPPPVSCDSLVWQGLRCEWGAGVLNLVFLLSLLLCSGSASVEGPDLCGLRCQVL